jgi:Predicted transcriptional regulator with C-terminal CBS domains
MLSQQLVEALVSERKRQGLTQKTVAERMGVHPHFVQIFEYQKREPKISTFERYAAALGKSIGVTLTDQ